MPALGAGSNSVGRGRMTAHGLIFFLLAGMLSIFSFVYFTVQRDVAKKRRLWPVAHVAAAAIAFGYLWGFGWPWWGRALALVGMIVAVRMSLFYSWFCPGCRDLIYGPELPEWEGKCPNCGEMLNRDQGRGTPAEANEPPEG